MAVRVIHDLYDGHTYYLYADSTEYFRMSLVNSETSKPLDLTTIDEIEWFVGPASVKNRYAEVIKTLSKNEIRILKDSSGNFTNTIQTYLAAEDTINFQGGYSHQIRVADGSGRKFRPMKGLLVFESAILYPPS